MGIRAWVANNVAVRGGINEVTVTDTPATGEVLTATSSSAASWQPGGGGGSLTLASVLAVLPPSGFYGDGRSGDVTVPTGDPWCPMEPLFCDDLIVPAGATLETGNFPIYVRGTLSGAGTIIIVEHDELCATSSAPPTPDWYGVWRTAGPGGAGGEVNGSNAPSVGQATLSPGGAGGAGSVGTGGTSPITVFADLKDEAGYTNVLELVLTGALVGIGSETGSAAGTPIGGGGGGGGGGGDDTGAVNLGGAGGSGNGGLLLCAATLSFTGTIDIRGGDGGPGTGDCGGGGGGGGGFAHIVYRQKTASYTLLDAGGAGGAGAGTGLAGADGADGVLIEQICY